MNTGARRSNKSPVTGLRYTRTYPGDSEDKRAARLFVYKQALHAPRVGHAIALAGTEPFAEVSLLRDYLKWTGSRVHFVDWAKDTRSRPQVLAALAQIKNHWPAANVVREDVNNVVARLPIIGLAVLDFMGFDRNSVMPCIQKTIERLSLGGIMAVTWFRGREVDEPCRSAWDVFEAARDIKDLDDRRRIGIQRLVNQWARALNVDLECLGEVDYQHKHSPMTVTVWRRHGS